MGNAILDGTKSRLPLLRFLDTNGDGTGTTDAIGNYSVTPATFFVQPPAGYKFILTELQIHLSDGGTFGSTVYGSLGAALTNGFSLLGKRNGVTILDLMSGVPVKNNDQLTHLTSRVNLISWAAVNNSLNITFSALDFDTPFILSAAAVDTLEVTLNDDFTGLVDHTFIVRGSIVGE